MSNHGISRRRFLQASGGILVTATAASGLATLAIPVQAQSLNMRVLNGHEAHTLLQVTRTIFPHDTLADMYYATVVRDLDAGAVDSDTTTALLKDGVIALDNALGLPWVNLSTGYRHDTLAAIQDEPFFKKIQGTAVVSLYNNDLAWRHFGYEGASFAKGGYIARGFNDLNWLPEPSDDASPAVG